MTVRTEQAVVVGGGTMGVGIAYVLWAAGYRVWVVEVDETRHATARARMVQLRDGALERGLLDPAQASTLDAGVLVVGGLDVVAREPHVLVEAVPESLELKQHVLSAAQDLRPALLATNTSSIAIDEIAHGLSRPDELVGMHFFNPVWSNPLVEIVVGDRTEEAAVAGARRLVDRMGKEAVVVRDRPGFASSRLGVLLGLEAIRMVEEGVACVEDVDRAMELGYRHPMGPLRLTDLVGLDVRLAIAENLFRTYGDRFEPPVLLRRMVAEGHLGKKSGQGFYPWP